MLLTKVRYSISQLNILTLEGSGQQISAPSAHACNKPVKCREVTAVSKSVKSSVWSYDVRITYFFSRYFALMNVLFSSLLKSKHTVSIPLR